MSTKIQIKLNSPIFKYLQTLGCYMKDDILCWIGNFNPKVMISDIYEI